MGTLFQDVLTGGGSIAARQARNAQDQQNAYNQQALELQRRQLDNYDRYAGIASGMTDRFAQMGLDDRTGADRNLSSLFSQYAGMNAIRGYDSPQAGQQAGNYNRTPTGGRLNAVAGQQAQAPAPLPAQNPAASPMTGGSPYDAPTAGTFTQPQQQILNQRIDAINNARRQALQEYRARAGAEANSAMERYINDQYDRQTSELTSQLQEASRQQAVENWRYGRQEQGNALQNLMNYYAGQRQAGTGQYGGAIGNYMALGQNAPYANASQLQQQMAQQQMAYQQQMQQLAQQRLGAMLNLAAFGFGGGFQQGRQQPQPNPSTNFVNPGGGGIQILPGDFQMLPASLSINPFRGIA